VRGGDPAGVGVEEEEENHAEGHEVHVDAEDYAGVIEAPTALHAADGIGCARHGEEDGKDEEGGGVVVREVGEEKSGGETEENQEAAAQKGMGMRIEEGMSHAVCLLRCVYNKDKCATGLVPVGGGWIC
jgi:hypothetical protein